MIAEATDALMVIAIHFQRRAPIPFLERRARHNAHQMPVFVVMFAGIDVLQLGVLLPLHIAV